jgi:hypothetical protein
VNPDALTYVWNAFRAGAGAGLSREAALDAFNAQSVPTGAQDVTVNDVLHHFALAPGKLRMFQAFAATAATNPTPATEAAMDFFVMLTFPGFGPFKTSDLATAQAVATMLASIASDPASGVTAADVAALLALAQTSASWAQANNFGAFITNAQLDERGLT